MKFHNSDKPDISVIIPTHNRCESISRAINALCNQTYPLKKMEVLVIADGCSDDTVEVLRKFRTPFALKVVEQQNQGLAASRNNGASHATGKILIFLDDDILPTANMIEAHALLHDNNNTGLVIGYYPPILMNYLDNFEKDQWICWGHIFYPLSCPGHQFKYNDIMFGNSSIRADLFKDTGGFNPAFRAYGREDWEYGMRLIKLGVNFKFSPRALGYHYPSADPFRTLRNKRSEGVADVKIGHLYPELKPFSPLNDLLSDGFLMRNIMRSLPLGYPVITNIITNMLMQILRLMGQLKLRLKWRTIWRELNYFWYWTGVMAELKTKQGLIDYLNDPQNSPEKEGKITEIDLLAGIKEAEEQIDINRPTGLSVNYGKHYIGFVSCDPGTENFRGKHLRRLLANDLAIPFLRILAAEGVITKAMNRESIGFPEESGLQAWIDELLGQKSWLDLYHGYTNQWKRISTNAKECWKKYGRVKNLELKRKGLEKKLSYYRQRSELYERRLGENRKIIEDLKLKSNIVK